MVKVASVVFGPMGTRFGHFPYRRVEWIILRLPFLGDHFTVVPSGKLASDASTTTPFLTVPLKLTLIV